MKIIGTEPTAISYPAIIHEESASLSLLLDRSALPKGIGYKPIQFGANIQGFLIYPDDVPTNKIRVPGVILLHPASVPKGFYPAYQRGEPLHLALARAGFAVLVFDQIGFGSRINEIQRFYDRYPDSSLLGRAITDATDALTALSPIPFIDLNRVYLVGCELGGYTALHTAALDERFAGVVSIAGFSPIRNPLIPGTSPGLERWSQWLPWNPRLSWFIGHESRAPYDLEELLSLVAPRPTLIVAPKYDYYCPAVRLHQCLDKAAKVYAFNGAAQNLLIYEPTDYTAMSPATIEHVAETLKILSLKPLPRR
jgi:pimeloyl-ACP methyl ester carboxylesterase